MLGALVSNISISPPCTANFFLADFFFFVEAFFGASAKGISKQNSTDKEINGCHQVQHLYSLPVLIVTVQTFFLVAG